MHVCEVSGPDHDSSPKPNEDAAPKQLAGEDRRKARKREAPGDTAITRDHVTSSVSLITNFVTLFVHPDTS